MSKVAAALALLLTACAPTAAELVAGGLQSAAARQACGINFGACPPAIACSGSVLVMASEGASRAAVKVSSAACVLPAVSIVHGFISLPILVGAVEVFADVVAAQLREREAARVVVRAQAAADLAAERARAQ